MISGQAALAYLTKPTAEEKKQAQRMLRKYRELKLIVEDYKAHSELLKQTIYESEITRRLDGDDLYANKTVNAVQLAQNQKRAAEECDLIRSAIERAVSMIPDEEARQAITLRYLKGYTYSETLYYMKRGDKSSTVDRRMNDGMLSVAHTLKMWGLLTWDINSESD
ncbi:hypothetical protein D3P07_23210 [Paenibacillus sp. 1011MAR3C5]|uniref:hypothetical protein n=1 Tax=Paenibacillus sp. 1011MAR3C5 TaxID=1675787 RepID=UPI000E6BC1F0|nr:hypothetical protein [Paenibacillus sp. 1011MAR3C5]RJE84280.1 hypothetical protein D3P07_23210 [Paenibacillus sp. 1011MAR3C5]